MKRLIFATIAVIVALTFGYYWKHPLGTTVTINGHVFKAQLAVTPQDKEKGLGYRPNLAPDSGMLFVFNHKEQYRFWMKGMQFPLDFIWIDGNKVADLTTNVPLPQDGQPLTIYSPKVPVDKIFEVNAGTVDRDGIKIGNTVKISQ